MKGSLIYHIRKPVIAFNESPEKSKYIQISGQLPN